MISLIDAEGRMVGRSVEPERWIGQPAPMERTLLLRRFAEGSGSAENVGLDGVPRIAGFARARSVSWLVYVGIPKEAALGPAGTNARESLALGIAMLLIGLVLATWVAGRIARPLRQLSADARLLGEGRFEHRSEVATGSEIGLLAHTLNRMAAALQERIAAARRSEERLTLALEGSGQALFDWDIAGNRIFCSARGSTMRGGPDQPFEISPQEMETHVHPDDLAAVSARVREAFAGRTPIYEVEFRVRHETAAGSGCTAAAAWSSATPPAGRCAWWAPTPTSPGRRRPSNCCASAPSSTPSPACRTGACSTTAWEARSSAPGAAARPWPCCSSTSITSRA